MTFQKIRTQSFPNGFFHLDCCLNRINVVKYICINVCIRISFIITSADNGWCSCFTQFQITSCSRRVYFLFYFCSAFRPSLFLIFLFTSDFFFFILFINAVYFFDSIKMKMRKSRNFIQMRHSTNHFARESDFFCRLSVGVDVVVVATSQEHHLLYFTRELQIQNKK